MEASGGSVGEYSREVSPSSCFGGPLDLAARILADSGIRCTNYIPAAGSDLSGDSGVAPASTKAP